MSAPVEAFAPSASLIINPHSAKGSQLKLGSRIFTRIQQKPQNLEAEFLRSRIFTITVVFYLNVPTFFAAPFFYYRNRKNSGE